MMKKLLVLALILAVAGLANAGLAYDSLSGVLSVNGTLTQDWYVIVNTDASVSGFAAGSAADVAGGFVGKSGEIADFQGSGCPDLIYANGEGWSMAAANNTYWPKTGTFLTADLSLNAVVSTGSTTSVLNAYMVEEVVAGGTWQRFYEDRLNEFFDQLGANVLVKLWTDANPLVAEDFGSDQYLGDKVITGSQMETVLVNEVFIPIPEPMTMVLLGLGGLFLRRKK
jgi:hypothetical protein